MSKTVVTGGLPTLRSCEPLDELSDGFEEIFLLVNRAFASRSHFSLSFPLGSGTSPKNKGSWKTPAKHDCTHFDDLDVAVGATV